MSCANAGKEDLPWIFCIQAISFVLFRVRPWRYTGIWDRRSISSAAGFSKSWVYAATPSGLATNYSRAAIISDGILLGVLPRGFRRRIGF
jgi:hypothetical protein